MTKQSTAKPPDSILNPDIKSQRSSEILYGAENAVGRGVQFMQNVKRRMDIFFDHRAPSIVIDLEEYRNGYRDIRRRGAKIRAFTEITKENIHYCKELMKLVDELRHLDGVKGGMAVSESEYMATTVLEESKPLTEVIYSNVKEVVEQNQYIFDTLWRSAISAEQKIKEIEEGRVTRYETRIIENPDEVIKEIGRLTASSNKLDTCLTSGGMQYSHNYFFDLKKKLLVKQKRGEHKGIRYITNIDNGNLYISKLYLEDGIQIRHIKNLPPMSFGVSDKEIAVTIEKMEGGRRIQSLLISTEPLYVRHFTSLFEEIWRNGIDARHRVKQVEEGVESDIEVIQNPDRTEELYWDIAKSAEKEILLILPTANAVSRQEKMGVIKYLAETAKSRNIQVRILMPKVNLSHYNPHHAIDESNPLHQQQDDSTDAPNVRYLQQLSDTKATILIADRKVSLVIELRDDTKSTFHEAIGLSTYSSSKPGVLSYVSIFENLWIQTELYEQLKLHDKMQKDFINIAAHELRTPIQPILGLTEALLSKSKDETAKELLEVVVRNAKRLRTLIENILDVTRIENQSLSLRKERFKINGIILNILEEYESRDNKRKNDLKIVFTSKDDFFIEADKGRVMQVISNLMNNAIKFTPKGAITVTTKKKEENNEIIVSIKDTGSGIDPEIMPRLFSKFATKSQTGTGLGLFVSQNIVEAHGGKIWAENNSDGRGCTFSFSLPLANSNL
ncbi:MAG TPA: HAMP domain-containing sensor histidine kinase [Nitrososphaeraceae archaeon]|nr:HAMP domain-containing sensor histidine kinase [Nitrososphaeraceae archaeon]